MNEMTYIYENFRKIVAKHSIHSILMLSNEYRNFSRKRLKIVK
jgi:hypothetical protein